MPNEEYAIVLDYLAKGRSASFRPEPVAQVLGIAFFTLLEVVPKDELLTLEKVYVGRDKRDKILQIKKRLTFNELTSTAVAELEKAIEKVVLEDEPRFVKFFNTAGSITIKRHQLELLPGLGKKHMMDILAERQKKQFENLKEIETRVPLMPDALKTIIKRIIEELRGDDPKHFLFARPPTPPEHEFGFNRRF
ncbi:MAG: DUF655 domain-containing protein [Candidatus Diapherotrites archaeon]|nr:DUF655 domain-containing protein [Candidatus Diapherotrites archaeon]